MPDKPIRRAFVDIAHGQIHCRLAGDPATALAPPLLLLHGGPGSSAGLVPMMSTLAARGIPVIAPDMMGNGLSDPPPAEPDLAFYVDCLLMLLDRLEVQRVDCYGHHVGAQIAGEFAIRATARVGRLVLDGIGLFPPPQRREFTTRYAPPVEPDAAGTHLAKIWHFLSTTTTQFPHYSEHERDRIPGGAPLPPALLTDQFADVVRNWRTYHLSYQASFQEDFGVRLPLISQPVTVLAVAGDPLVRNAVTAIGLLSNARLLRVDRAARPNAIADILCPAKS